MTFIGYPIATGVIGGAISKPSINNCANSVTYGENVAWTNGNVHFCTYNKLVGGYYQVFVAFSLDNGTTWTEEQVTTDNYHKYGSSCCMDIYGTGVHLVFSTLGRLNSIYTKAMMYNFRTFVTATTGTWGVEQYVEKSGWNVNHPGYPAFRHENCDAPSIAIDASDNVHCAFEHWDTFNTLTRRGWQCVMYQKRDAVSGNWGEKVTLRYKNGGIRPILKIPNLQTDFYGNPHIVCTINKPLASWGSDTHTTCWIANDMQGDKLGWPGSYDAYYSYYIGTFPTDDMCQLLYDTPTASAGAVSNYPRLALSHIYCDEIAGYDYPHAVYMVISPGSPIGPYYKYKDSIGWHTEAITTGGPTINSPSIALAPNGLIHTVVPDESVGAKYDHRTKVTPDASWSVTKEIEGLLYPRQEHQRYPVQYPMDDMACSPFIAVTGSTLTYYKCADESDDYGYFM